MTEMDASGVGAGMGAGMGTETGLERQTRLTLLGAIERLQAAGVQPDALAEYVAPRRKFLVQRAATMTPLGEAWRLGTLLLGLDPDPDPETPDSPALWAAGHTTRAAKRLHPGNQSLSREARRDLAAAALQGGYEEGRSVNFDAVRIPLDAVSLGELGPDSPIGVSGSGAGAEIRVRWRAGASLDGAPTLASYLEERIELLINGTNPA